MLHVENEFRIADRSRFLIENFEVMNFFLSGARKDAWICSTYARHRISPWLFATVNFTQSVLMLAIRILNGICHLQRIQEASVRWKSIMKFTIASNFFSFNYSCKCNYSIGCDYCDSNLYVTIKDMVIKPNYNIARNETQVLLSNLKFHFFLFRTIMLTLIQALLIYTKYKKYRARWKLTYVILTSKFPVSSQTKCLPERFFVINNRLKSSGARK